jgi:DNA-binding response OmpR family regulator
MGQKKKILIVEDELDFAAMVKLRLELTGYDVSIAEDADNGLQKVMDEKFDLIVLDLMIPAGGGFSLLERIKDLPDKASIPVVVLTGKTIDADVKALIGAYRVAGLFTKPYDSVKFVAKIKSLAPI